MMLAFWAFSIFITKVNNKQLFWLSTGSYFAFNCGRVIISTEFMNFQN